MEQPTTNSFELKKQNENLKFNRGIDTLLLGITPNKFTLENLKLLAEEKGLTQKSEFHATIIGSDTGDVIKEKLQILSPDEKTKLVQVIEELANEFNWSYTPLDEYYLISKIYEEQEKRSSLIQVIDLPDLTSYYLKLNELLGTTFSLPFPHITLFTTSTKEEKKLRGIGIYSKDQLSELNAEKIEVK
jgi:hypothetical protein